MSLKGLSDKKLKNMVRCLDIRQLEICGENCSRPLTQDDIDLFPERSAS